MALIANEEMKLNCWLLVQLCPLLVKRSFPGMDLARFSTEIVCNRSLTINQSRMREGGCNNPTASQVVLSASIQQQKKGDSPRTKKGKKK